MILRSKLFTTRFLIISCCFLLLFTSKVKAQYVVNGNATQDDCNCYTLTKAIDTQSGSVWNENKISLSSSFDYKFEVYLGNNDAGADGIAFVLQPISTSVGSSGGGMGYQGVTPAVGVTIDTYKNSNSHDPSYDHIAIQLNGDIDHNSSNNIAGPVQALASSSNIEDGQWHDFRITWDISTNEMKSFMDGSLRVSATIDLVNSVFNGDPEVFWGFTGSTGGKNNLQRFCTKNEANFSIDQTLAHCLGDEIDFQDNSSSFGHIIKWYWDFGDGTNETITTQGNISHTYTSTGNYDVTLKVEGNDGCVSDVQTISVDVYANPVATATVNSPICEDETINFEASGGGTYKWLGTNGYTSTQQNVAIPNASLAYNGTDTLIVTSPHGCTDTATVDVVVNPKPIVNAGTDLSLCEGESTTLTATSNANGVTFTWDNGLGAGDTQEITPSTNTTYIVIGENSFACTDESSVIVTVNPLPDYKIENSLSPTCGNNDGQITFNGGLDPSSNYDLSYGKDGTVVGPQTITTNANGEIILDNLPKGDYTDFELSLNGCTTKIDTTLLLNPSDMPTIDAPSDLDICAGESVTLVASNYSSSTPISWNHNVQDGDVVNPTTTTTYIVTATNDNCVASDSTIVTVHSKPTAVISGDAEVCQFDDSPKVVFTGNNGTEPYVFLFTSFYGTNPPSVDSIISTNGNIGTIDVPTNNPGTYTYNLLEVHNKNAPTCPNTQTDEVVITVIQKPDVSLIAAPIEGVFPLNVSFTNTSSNASQYLWNFGDGNGSSNNDSVVQHTFEDTGIYSTMLIGDNQGCTDTAYVTITVSFPIMEYKFPNIFTPNEDGENDNFHIIDSKNIKDFEIEILNRWGNLVFESQDINFNWNGKVKNSGSKCTEGTYFYKAILTNMNDEKTTESGFVELIIGD